MTDSIIVLYATREGHTERIAGYVAEQIRSRGRTAEVLPVAHLPAGFDLACYSAAILAASVHLGKHEREMTAFVKQHAADLQRIPGIFLSVSLSEAGAEDPTATPEARVKSAADVEHMIQDFVRETGWHPSEAKPVAGALLFSKYNWIMRFAMKRIAKAAGAPTDTAHDYEFTDWAALDRVAEDAISHPGRSGSQYLSAAAAPGSN
jgi:menaquinone-dependent protoporphyrinogen oxidase